MIEPQLTHARKLISLLHPEPHAGALIEITSMPSKSRAHKEYFFYPELAAEHAVEQTIAGNGVFVGLNPRSQMAAFETDVPYVTTIGLDLQPEKNGFGGDDALVLLRNEVEKRLALGNILPTATAMSGNGLHMYFRLAEPADPPKAKIVWERLCRFTGSDAIFNVNRIFRVPGTLNWKSNPPRWCYLMGEPEPRYYTIEQIDAALDKLGAGPARPPKEGIPVPVDPPEDVTELFKRLPESAAFAIRTGERNPLSEGQSSRSEADWLVVCALVRAGCSDEMIAWVYNQYPIKLLKYHEAGARYLSITIERARRDTAEPTEQVPTSNRYRSRRARGSSGDPRR
jgi:hypothetical protein